MSNPFRCWSPAQALLGLLLGILLVIPRVELSAAESASVLSPEFQWPQWRGPFGNGLSLDKKLPLHWSTNKNVLWAVPLTERGNSTPIVWGNRLFLTQAGANSGRRSLRCFDTTTGQLLWERGVTVSSAAGTAEMTHETNPPGSSSAVTDGERVIAWFGSGGLYCFDFQGVEQWHQDLGRQRHIWGWGSSPVIVGERCFLNFGPGEPSFLASFDKKTGRELWRENAPDADSGEKKAGQEKPTWSGSWATPIAARIDGREQLLLGWPRRLTAFDPANGHTLWFCEGLNPLVYTSPLYDSKAGIAVAMGGYAGMALAVRAGGEGDVTASRRLWHHPKTRQRIGSGVIHDGYIYIHTDPGIAECWELASGKLVWEERLRGPGPKGDNWSSMVLAGDRLYSINQGGDAFVLKAAPHFEPLATNSLAEPTIASMAMASGRIYIRTHQRLWCIGEK